MADCILPTDQSAYAKDSQPKTGSELYYPGPYSRETLEAKIREFQAGMLGSDALLVEIAAALLRLESGAPVIPAAC